MRYVIDRRRCGVKLEISLSLSDMISSRYAHPSLLHYTCQQAGVIGSPQSTLSHSSLLTVGFTTLLSSRSSYITLSLETIILFIRINHLLQ